MHIMKNIIIITAQWAFKNKKRTQRPLYVTNNPYLRWWFASATYYVNLPASY